MSKCALTTTDNIYDPFSDFRKWADYDHIHGYCSAELVDRTLPIYLSKVGYSEKELTEEELDDIYEQTIDGILKYIDIPLGKDSNGDYIWYKKVTKEWYFKYPLYIWMIFL